MEKDGIGKNVNNILLESGFSVFKESIEKDGRIIFDHALEKASYHFNKYLNRGHKAFITGRRTHPINEK